MGVTDGKAATMAATVVAAVTVTVATAAATVIPTVAGYVHLPSPVCFGGDDAGLLYLVVAPSLSAPCAGILWI